MTISIRDLFARVNFARGRLYDTNDLDQARVECARVLNPHRIQVITTPNPNFRASMDYLPFGNMSFGQLTWGTAVSIDPYQLDSYYLLSMPTSGRACLILDGHETVISEGCIGVVNASQRFHFTTSKDFHQILLRIEKRTVDQCWQGLTGQAPTRPIIFSPTLSQTSNAWQALEPMFHLLARCFEHNRQPSSQPFLELRLEEMLVMSLLLNHPHSHARQLDLLPAQTTPRQLRQAKEFMLAHLETPLRLTEISLHTGTSTRHLQTLFQENYHCGPMQWLKEQRLNAVRTTLLNSDDDSRISDIAMRYGFYHLGEFNKAYKKLFGTTPRITRER